MAPVRVSVPPPCLTRPPVPVIAGRKRGVAGAIGGQHAGAQRDRPAGARQRAHRQVVAVEVEGAAVHRERARRGERAAGAQLQRAARHGRATGIAVCARQDQGAGILLGQAAASGHHAGIGTDRGLVEHDRGIVDDAALQADGVALKGAGRHRCAAGIGVCAGQDQRAGVLLGEAAGAGHDAGIGVGAALVEYHRGVVEDVALQAGRVALQRASRHRCAACIGICTGQGQRADALLDEAAAARNHGRQRGDVAIAAGQRAGAQQDRAAGA